MVNIRRGDVVFCKFDPVIGSEQAGTRPAVVLQVDPANRVSPLTIVAPLTSKIGRASLRSHVFIPAGVGGLVADSVLLCEQIKAIDKQRITNVRGHLDPSYMEAVENALRLVLGL